jgi:hypothetical protein
MFFCKYCGLDRDDSLIGIEYKCSIKCDICIRKGTKLTDTRQKCVCGVSYTNNSTTHTAHIKSKNHLEYIKGLSS